MNSNNRPLESKTDEMTAFYQFLSDKVTSCTDAANKLNIPQKHLTRYKRKFEEAGQLQVVRILRCPHTRRWVQYITTDKSRFTNSPQLQIPFLGCIASSRGDNRRHTGPDIDNSSNNLQN